MAFLPPVTVNAGVSLFNCSCPSNDPQWSGMLQVGAKLYMMTTDLGSNTLNAYRSADNGNTWARLDQAHEPTMTSAQNGVFVPNGTTFFCAVDNTGVGHNIYLIQFDCLTETWGALSAAAPFTSESFKGIWMNQDGDLVFLYTNVVSPSGETIFAAKNAGGAWGVPYTVDNNNTTNGGGSGHVGFCAVGGWMHGNNLLMEYLSQDFVAHHWISYHQEIDTHAGTLGYFQVLYTDTNSFPSVGNPAVLGSNVIVPVFLNNLADPDKRTVGSFSGPIGGPLVVSAGPIDPGFATDPSLYMIANQPGWCASASGLLGLTYCCGNQAQTDIRGRCRYLTTHDGLTWTGETVFDNSADTASISVVRVPTVTFGSTLINFVATVAGTQTMLFAPLGGGGPSVPTIITSALVVNLPDPQRPC